MRTASLILFLVLATNALAVRLGVPHRPAFEPVESQRKAKVLRDALTAFTLPDGSEWIIHRVPAQREPSAFGVTRFGRDGSARVFLVSDWLPKGSIPRGWCGQVYGVTLLTDGRVAVSAGWTDGRDSHNGIFVLRAGTYDAETWFEVPGVSEISGAQRNTILAVTNDPSRRGGGPLLTLYDTQGRKVAGFFDHDGLLSPAEALQNATKARLQRVDDQTFAFYDPVREEVILFDLKVDENVRGAVFSGRQGIFIGDDAATARLPVLGIDAWNSRHILVTRVGLVRGKPGTLLTLYGPDGLAKETAILDRPWSLMLHEKGRVRGVLLRNDVELDSVTLNDSD